MIKEVKEPVKIPAAKPSKHEVDPSKPILLDVKEPEKDEILIRP